MPIPSYGVILFTIAKSSTGDTELYYLLSQRRDTIEYVDIMRPKCPVSQFRKWASLMSRDERLKLQTYIDDFDILWKDLMMRNPYVYDRKYVDARDRFLRVKNELLEAIVSTQSHVINPHWGFPKGRRNRDEDVVDTALREFEEETCFKSSQIRPYVSSHMFSEVFNGSDMKEYSTQYFLYETFSKLPVVYKNSYSEIKGREKTISYEVSDLKWVTFKEALGMLNPRRQRLLADVHKFIIDTKN